MEDGLILFKGKIYVPNNLELRREIVRIHHDPPGRGHPGRYQTQELVNRNYWWPGLGRFIKEYVEGCAVCQESKNITHPTKEPLHPTELPTRPFQIITSDFITGLPLSQGFDAIMTVMDTNTKTLILEPCTTSITAEETAKILIKRVFSQHGIPEKLISDRGPQYSSKVMGSILKSLGIRSALSTAYHPQTDGASERANQSTEQYLRAYCNQNQDNWAELLPLAELAHNTHIHSATGNSPFYLVHGYDIKWPSDLLRDLEVPKAGERIDKINKAQKEAQAAMKMTQEKMRYYHDGWNLKQPQFKQGDQVWIHGENLKVQTASKKLSPRRYGPFEIIKPIGQGSYLIRTPKSWKIHPVFHSSLLLPYRETEAHGVNYTKPPPEIIADIPEWEVEEVKGLQRWRKKWQYYIKWKGYPNSNSSWEPI